MNPGKLNHRIRFAALVSTRDEFGGVASLVETPVTVSDSIPTDTTWGSLEPLRQYQQYLVEGDASVFNSSRILIIRYRVGFEPTKDMIFEDMNTAGDKYTIHSILPYYPGTKNTFQNAQETTYKDKVFRFIIGIKRT